MPKFEVEFRRTSFITVTVEADNDNHAEELAWAELDAGNEADYEVESVEQVRS